MLTRYLKANAAGRLSIDLHYGVAPADHLRVGSAQATLRSLVCPLHKQVDYNILWVVRSAPKGLVSWPAAPEQAILDGGIDMAAILRRTRHYS
jgi:hypothetical protein